MPGTELSSVLLEATRLHNTYALAIDTRNWELFSTVFSPTVVATFPHRRSFTSLQDWLDDFIPTHDQFVWTRHAMSTHVVGEDSAGIWASCYGDIQWMHRSTRDRYKRSFTLYRDRLEMIDGNWKIARRICSDLMSQNDLPLSDGTSFAASIHDLSDMS